MGSLDVYEKLFKANCARQRMADGEAEEAQIIQDHFADKLRNMGIDPDKAAVWIQSPVLTLWVQEAIPGFGGRMGRSAATHLRNMVKLGLLPEMSCNIESWPHHGKNRRRGMMWGDERYNDPDWTGTVRILVKDSEDKVKEEN